MNDLWTYEKEKVQIICTDGQVLRGIVRYYIDAEDNDPPRESIVLNLFIGGYPTEVYKDEIQSIEILP